MIGVVQAFVRRHGQDFKTSRLAVSRPSTPRESFRAHARRALCSQICDHQHFLPFARQHLCDLTLREKCLANIPYRDSWPSLGLCRKLCCNLSHNGAPFTDVLPEWVSLGVEAMVDNGVPPCTRSLVACHKGRHGYLKNLQHGMEWQQHDFLQHALRCRSPW
jgi:hypothetical protein